MKSASPVPVHRPQVPVFPLACGFLGLMVLCQLLVAGVALGKRFDESRRVRTVVKEVEVPKYITVELPAPPPVEVPVIVRSQDPRELLSTPGPAPTPLAAPEIADPRAERLVREGRAARVAGDMGMAILKLEEAMVNAPGDPVIHYEMGLVHEQMGVFDVAASHYEAVFQAGISGAGNLYELAAAKLRDGFSQPDDMHGKLSLGRVRIFKNPDDERGNQTILSIPVQRAPGVDVEVGDIEVTVVFFNKNERGEISQLQDPSWVEQSWVTLPFDWVGGEETLRMHYIIPRQEAGNEHLFGNLRYHGQVVTLLYQGEVLDVQAWPRDLAARVANPAQHNASGQMPEFFDPGLMPPDFDPDNPLLPSLPEY